MADFLKSERVVLWGFFGVLLGGLYILLPVLAPFLLGLGLAYLLHPFVDLMGTKGMVRWLSSFFIVFSIVCLFIGFWVLFFPFFTHQLQQLLVKMPGYLQSVMNEWQPYVKLLLQKARLVSSVERFESLILDTTRGGISWLVNTFFTWLSQAGVFNIFFYLLVTPVVTFYSLVEWPALVRYAHHFIPFRYRTAVFSFMEEVDQAMTGYVRGQALVCVSMAIYLAIGFSLLRIPHGVLLGLFTGLMVFVPYVGMILGSLMAVLIILVNNPAWWPLLNLGGVLMLGQILEAIFFVPYFVGRRVDIHPVWILLAIFSIGGLLGFWGVLLALPFATFLRISLMRLVTFYKNTVFFKTTRA